MSDKEGVTLAFQRVFGTNDNHRSKEQRIVLARLRELAKPGESQWLAGQDDTALSFAQGRLRMWHAIAKHIEPQPETLRELLGPSADLGDDDNDDSST
jgi:hypothetical protein